MLDHLTRNAQDFLVFKAGLLMQDVGDDPVKKAAAIHDIVESVALVPDLVLRSLYVQQCSRLLQVNEQALISEMNKVLRRQYRKHLGGDQPVPEELLQAEMVASDLEGAEREVFKRIRALRLEVPAEVASDVHGCVSSCLAGYRVRLAKAQAEVARLKGGEDHPNGC